MKKEDLEKIAEEVGLEAGNFKEADIPWHKKLLLKISPRLFFKMESKEIGIDSSKIDLADKLFGDAKRIDIRPLSGGSRGFIIFLDNKFSLWFFQEGDHSVYDGFEMGE